MAAEAVGRFVDTNVLVYAHDSSAGAKRVIARDLLQGLWQTGAGRLSVQVLQEFFVALTRKVRKPLAVEDARAIVADLAHWQIHAPASADVLAAIDLHRRGGLSFWDAMIVHSAVALSCDVLYSEDLTSGHRYTGVLVVDPFVSS